MKNTQTTSNTEPSLFIDVVTEDCELFHNAGNEPFVSTMIDGNAEILSVSDKRFSLLLSKKYYDLYSKLPSDKVLKETINMVAAHATFEAPEKELFVRIAEQDGHIYIDLANEEKEQVKITADSWDIIAAKDSPINFIQYSRMRPMATPVKNGSFDKLWDFINIKDDSDKTLAIAWLVSVFQPNGPYPILNLQGEQGTGKSRSTRLFRDLVDPTFPALTCLPKSERDLAISAPKQRILAFDNISKISDWLSDAFCRLSTGGGFVTRSLYTNDGEAVFDYIMPVIMNGISEIITRHDLGDRAISITLGHLKGKVIPERIMDKQWGAAKPEIMGAIFDAVSTALRNRDDLQLDSYPRMADFVHWTVAAEPSLPWDAGTFVDEYANNRQRIVEDAIEADPVASAVIVLMSTQAQWSGTATELLAELNSTILDDIRRLKVWPKQPNILSGKLSRSASFLREKSIEIEFSKSGTRNISIYTNPLQNKPLYLPAPQQ